MQMPPRTSPDGMRWMQMWRMLVRDPLYGYVRVSRPSAMSTRHICSGFLTYISTYSYTYDLLHGVPLYYTILDTSGPALDISLDS